MAATVLLNDLHLSEVLVKKEMFFKLAAAMECKRGSRGGILRALWVGVETEVDDMTVYR